MERYKEIVTVGVGVTGAACSNLLGGWDGILRALIVCMVVDYISGLMVAGVFKASPKSQNGALESGAGYKGLCRKGMMLFIVLIAHYLDIATGASFVRDGIIYGFITNEVISIIENAGLMGIPVPKALSKAIDILASKASKEQEE